MAIYRSIDRFLRDGIAAIFQFVEIIWTWSIEQIRAIPWSNLSDLPILKQVLLVIVAGAVIYLLYKAARELFEAGQNALSGLRHAAWRDRAHARADPDRRADSRRRRLDRQ